MRALPRGFKSLKGGVFSLPCCICTWSFLSTGVLEVPWLFVLWAIVKGRQLFGYCQITGRILVKVYHKPHCTCRLVREGACQENVPSNLTLTVSSG